MKRQATDCRYICKLYICYRTCIQICKNSYNQQTTTKSKTRTQLKKVWGLTVWLCRSTTDPLLMYLPGSHVHHVWFLQCQHYEESGSNSSNWRVGSMLWKFPTQQKIWNNSVCRMPNMIPLLTGVSSSRNPFRPPKICSFCSEMNLWMYSKPLFMNWWIFKES